MNRGNPRGLHPTRDKRTVLKALPFTVPGQNKSGPCYPPGGAPLDRGESMEEDPPQQPSPNKTQCP